MACHVARGFEGDLSAFLDTPLFVVAATLRRIGSKRLYQITVARDVAQRIEVGERSGLRASRARDNERKEQKG